MPRDVAETFENLDHMFALQTLSHFDGNVFAAEYVYNGKSPDLLSEAELVVQEVEAPCFVGL
jgi:hypothetical protein